MHDPSEISLSEGVGKMHPHGICVPEVRPAVEVELARYLPQLGRMSEQLRQTSAQIEESVVSVCDSFQGIAARARATVTRATGFLGHGRESTSGKQSFEGLIRACGDLLVRIMKTTEEAGDISRRAIERIEQMDQASQQISHALGQLDDIARGNRMLAFNARIEAAHAGNEGMGFAVVAVELAAQTTKSRAVTAHVGELALNLRALAESTVEDLRRMTDQDSARVEQCRREVDDSLKDLQAAHSEMSDMLNGMTAEGALLATDIGAAVRGMQFQDRTSQRIAHVVEDLDTLHARLIKHVGHVSNVAPGEGAADDGFSAYTMQEERAVAGVGGTESSAGDVELF
jgi:methyl-accepting chemotaxis protein